MPHTRRVDVNAMQKPQDASPRPLRVLFVLPSLRMGGAEHQATLYAVALQESGLDVAVGAFSVVGQLVPILETAGVDLHVLRRGRPAHRPAAWLSHIVGLVRLVSLVRRLKPDVIQAFMSAASIYAAIARIASRSTAVLIVSKRNLGLYKAERKWLARGERWASRVADAVHVNSDAVGRAVLATEGIPPSRLLRIYNGVDTDKFCPGPHTTTADLFATSPGPTLVTVANLHPYKGYDVLLRAMPVVAAQYPGVLLLCVGDDRGEKSRLLGLAEELGIAGHVRFLGHQGDVAAILRQSDAAVHPSLQEGFSNAILEAMACAKPVVATRVGGTAEAVVDGVTGYLVEPGDPSALGQAILRVLDDPQHSAEMGIAGRVRVVEHFSIRHAVAELESTYRHLNEARRERFSAQERTRPRTTRKERGRP